MVLAGFCSFLSVYATQPLLPMLAEMFHVSAAAISLTVTATTIGVALVAPVAGTLADRYGRKNTIVCSALGLGLMTLLAATASNLEVLLLWRFLQGIFTPGIFAVTIAYIHEEWRGSTGQVTSAYVAGTVIGGFTGRFLAGLIATHFGWPHVFVGLGAVSLLGAAAIARWLPRESGTAKTRDIGTLNAVLRHLRNPLLRGAYVVGFCVLFCMTATFTYINFYLAAPPFHLGPAALGSLFLTYLVGAVVTPIGGRWIDRLGHRRMLSWAIGGGLVGSLLTLAPGLPWVVAGLTLSCTSVFIAQSTASSYLGMATSENRALAIGLYVTFYYLGGSAGAMVPGWFWNLGGWTACVLLIAGIQVLTIGLALNLWARPVSRSVLR